MTTTANETPEGLKMIRDNSKSRDKLYASVTVQSWEFSHYTGNGNSVHKFVIETEKGLTIEGKTAPNNGFAGMLPSSPKKLINVNIRTSPTGRITMTEATRAA